MPSTQFSIALPQKPRGFHLITNDIVNQIDLTGAGHGVLHLFIQHSSASLTINENADPTVRGDMERFVNRLVPDETNGFVHTDEGPDDMPAHVKASIFGSSLTIPFSHGKLLLGTWQGIWLGEHRNSGGSRRVIATVLNA